MTDPISQALRDLMTREKLFPRHEQSVLGFLDEHGVTHETEVFPTTEHGFAFPEREVYHEPYAEIVWNKMFKLYARVLG